MDGNKIPGLPAVSENGNRFVFCERFGKNINDTAFAISTLPGAVHITVTEDGIGEFVNFMVKSEIFFRHPLCKSIKRTGSGNQIFCKRERGIISINRGGGREDNFLHICFACGFQYTEHTADVYIRVQIGIINRSGNHGLRCFVIDNVEMSFFKDIRQFFIPDIHFEKFRFFGKKIFCSARKIIYDCDFMSGSEERIG